MKERFYHEYVPELLDVSIPDRQNYFADHCRACKISTKPEFQN